MYTTIQLDSGQHLHPDRAGISQLCMKNGCKSDAIESNWSGNGQGTE